MCVLMLLGTCVKSTWKRADVGVYISVLTLKLAYMCRCFFPIVTFNVTGMMESREQ